MNNNQNKTRFIAIYIVITLLACNAINAGENIAKKYKKNRILQIASDASTDTSDDSGTDSDCDCSKDPTSDSCLSGSVDCNDLSKDSVAKEAVLYTG